MHALASVVAIASNRTVRQSEREPRDESTVLVPQPQPVVA
jgi:hypothetical protein